MRFGVMGTVAAAVIAAGAAGAGAATVNFNFQGNAANQAAYTGAGPAGGSASQTWNLATPDNSGSQSFTEGKTSDGLTTTTEGVSVAGTGSYAAGITGGHSTGNTLLDNYVYTSGTSDFTISGLDNASSYDVYLISQDGSYNNGHETTFAITSQTGVTSQAATSTGGTTFTSGVNYVEFTGLTPTFNATTNTYDITGTFAKTAVEGDINGIQVVGTAPAAVPEPATLVVAGLGIAGLLLGKRRKARVA